MIFDICHSFINIFADGYSNIKTVLFFAYFLLLLVLYLYFRKQVTRKLKWLYLGISMLVLYLYGLGLHLVYIIQNHIPLMKAFITGYNGEISYGALWHIHITKAYVGVLFPHLNNIDAGRAYLDSFPHWLFLIGTVLLTINLVLVIVYFSTSFISILKNLKRRQILFLTLSYCILSFSLIKTAIDGGLFHPSFITGATIIALFILERKNKLSKYYQYIFIGIGIILMLISIYVNHLQYGDGWAYIKGAVLILFYQLIFYCTQKKIKLISLLILITLFLTSWWLNAYRDFGMYKYGQLTLPNNKNVYYYDKNDNEVKTYQDKEGKNIKNLTQELNKNINYLPITISGKTCQESLPYRKINLTLISNEFIPKNNFFGSKMLKISNKESVAIGNKWKTDFTFYRSVCLPETFSAVNGEFSKNGINSYIYYNFFGF